MEDVAARSRYARNMAPGKKRRRLAADSSRLPRLIAGQLLASIVLLLVVVIAKSINTPATNFVTDKVRYVLVQNMELNSIFDYVNKAAANVKASITGDGSLLHNGTQDKPASGATAPNAATTGASTSNVTGDGSVSQVSPPEHKAGAPSSAASSGSAGAMEPATSVLSASYVSKQATTAAMQAPVSGVLSSPWGERTDPLTGSPKFHAGIDIEAAKGAEIKAAMDGTVEESGSSPSYGNYVKLLHAGGLETVYAHCSALDVDQGADVKQGETIAQVGDTGASVGTHLHFEVLKDGKSVDPLDYITIGK